MFELGGVTVTLGTLVAVLALLVGTVWIAWRRSSAIVAAGLLVGGVHAVAAFTDYLDPATVTSARETLLERGVAGFFALAAGFDTVFAAIASAISWVLDALDATGMPGVEVSVLSFVSTLLGLAVVSALVCGALVWIGRWADGAPLGGVLASLGVVFGAVGTLWTWLPLDLGDLSALYTLLVVGAVAAGYVLGVSALGVSPRPPTPERLRPER
ncbi:hypothetical protein [Halalkalicoccus subterraneus]|uniref:hypothetical protein n=1 Tax=Halalkalicoccus subterraneus TaxID=2675002 RepID=UPI000EFAC442|nr:hypothetical protein [Halalkalicoccus subterraneus]